jgi:hypothetical protein
MVTTADVGFFVANLNRNCTAELSAQLLDVTEAAEAYSDWTQAAAAGYEYIKNPEPGYGAWMMRELDSHYDPFEPEGLIYVLDSSGRERLAGIFWVVSDGVAPDAFAGSEDVWRDHYDVCVDEDSWDEGMSPANCDGVHWEEVGNVMVAWVRLANPDGIFVERNPEA